MKDDLNYPNQCLSQSSRKGVRHLRFGWMHMVLLEQGLYLPIGVQN